MGKGWVKQSKILDYFFKWTQMYQIKLVIILLKFDKIVFLGRFKMLIKLVTFC